jgi:hypothetical protein
VIGDVQHDRDGIDWLIPSSRRGQTKAIAVFAGEVKFPCAELVVEHPILLLPCLDVRQCSNVDGSLQELVYLREDTDDLDIVAEGTEVFWFVHAVVSPFCSFEPSSIHRLILREHVVTARLPSISGLNTMHLIAFLFRRQHTNFRSISLSDSANSNAVATVAYRSRIYTIQNNLLLCSSSMNDWGSGRTIARRV